ncbi:PREDICTED: cytochrome P450 6k1-like [Eufriesea mexicana]|uniref:cytochrome P450 6k1-like n=1 Tax=Eufriesea mexicana TaxID=516756 RepID=UPI00083C21A1|nr:PREDICTED: cytochrome P450 6k1-like [Eufriesea mexicana]
MAVLYSFIIDIFLMIVIFGAILFLYIKYKFTYWQRRGVRTLPSHWFFGNMKDIIKFQKSPAFVIGDLHQKGSEDDDVLGIYIFHKPFLLLRSPELIKQILIKDFNYFPDRYFTAQSFKDQIGSSNLFTIHNPEWKYLRTKLTPVFSTGKVKKAFNFINETAEAMNKYLEEQFLNGTKTKTIVIKDIATKYTTDIISSIAFGVQVNSFDPAQVQFFEKAEKVSEVTPWRAFQFFLMFFFPRLALYVGGQMLGTSTNYFRKVFWDSMDSREMSNVKRGDLIDSLLDLKNQKQGDEFKFDGDALVSQSAIFFIAGRESSIVTICFTLYELAKYPEIQKKARAEIHEKLKEHGMNYEGVLSMKYLYQVMSETLRLYPPAPLLDRVAVTDYKIPGTNIVIEKGTPVYIALTGLHRDSRFHPDPLCFNPDRFSDENKENVTQCTYMPFGDGPRVCIGTRLGLLQSAVALIAILKDYEVSLDPTFKGDVDIRKVFLSPVDGFRVNLTKL